MASVGNPFAGNVPRQISNDELIQALRVDIADEYEAIIAYEAIILATNDERAKKILHQISDEEKKHVGELQQLINLLNPQELQHVDKGKQVVQQQEQSNFQQPLQ